jgi:hypothetical protein
LADKLPGEQQHVSGGNAMKLQRAWLLAMVLLLVAGMAGYSAEPDAEQEAAIAAIKKLGGKVHVDDKRPGKPVVAVGLRSTRVTDAGLVHLKGLTQLQGLDLNFTKVTDAGLVHLKGLTKLQVLYLWRTEVTDAGLVHLKGLTQLQSLNLLSTEVTDAGLVQLKGLTQLQSLDLRSTRVTDEGVKNLQQALPKCIIDH